MSSPSTESVIPLDLSRWRKVPNVLVAGGGLLALMGLVTKPHELGFAWLQAFMFFLSIGLGGMFMVLIHHLFDAQWTVPIRRICEHLACLLFPWMGILFVPLLFLAPQMYEWMHADPHVDHALGAKAGYLNPTFWYLRVFILFALWGWINHSFRRWSLAQDVDGSSQWTHRSRKMAAFGIFVFAFSLTIAAVDWMKSIEYQWFSTMYGVWYFAASVWTALITIYILVYVLQRVGPLKGVVLDRTLHDNGVLFFAFTVFYAYITFSQYFLIWNAAIPEETFWFAEREVGSWKDVGYLIVFGHFFIPFLALLSIRAKKTGWLMAIVAVWAWLMHMVDLSYNIMPKIRPDGFELHWMDVGCWALMAGVLSKAFMRDLMRHPAYPQRDPRIAETMGVYVKPLSKAKTAKTGGAQ